MKRYAHLDDAESIFFDQQLENVKSKTYDMLYPEMKHRALIPASFDGHPADEFCTYYQLDQIGMAKIVADFANDFPAISVLGKKFRSEIQSLGASYGYSLQEIRAAQKTGRPLTTMLSNASKRAMTQKERDLAFYGDALYGVPGWFTNANIPDVALISGDWLNVARTADQIIADLNKLANAPISNSKTTLTANTLLLPVPYLTLISSTPRSTTSDTTILEFFLKASPFIQSVDWVAELTPANSGGMIARSLGLVYNRNPEYLWLEVPQDFEQFDAQLDGLHYKVPVHQRCGGTIIPYPLAQAKTDDLDAP
jgi:hypothetical protein